MKKHASAPRCNLRSSSAICTLTAGKSTYAVRWNLCQRGVCRVPHIKHTANKIFAMCRWKRHTANFKRKILNPVTPVPYLPCAYGWNPWQTLNTRQTFETHNGIFFCRVPSLGTRQTNTFAVCLGRSTRQSIDKNVKLALPNFSEIHLLCMDLDVNIWYFSNSLCYI